MEDPSHEVRRILSNNTVQDSLDYLASISRTIDESASSLKAVIGNSYKDLIAACDRVVGMERTCQELLYLRDYLHEANTQAIQTPSANAPAPSHSQKDQRDGGPPTEASLKRGGSLTDIVALLTLHDAKKHRKQRISHNRQQEPADDGDREKAEAEAEKAQGGNEGQRGTDVQGRERGCTPAERRLAMQRHQREQASGRPACASLSPPPATAADPASTALALHQQFLSVEGFLAADALVEAAQALANVSAQVREAKRAMSQQRRGQAPPPLSAQQVPHASDGDAPSGSAAAARAGGTASACVPTGAEAVATSPARGRAQAKKEGVEGRKRSEKAADGGDTEDHFWADAETMRDGYARRTLERMRVNISADADAVALCAIHGAFRQVEATRAHMPEGKDPSTAATTSATRTEDKRAGNDSEEEEEERALSPAERAVQDAELLERMRAAALARFASYHRALALLRPSREVLLRVVGAASSGISSFASSSSPSAEAREEGDDVTGFNEVHVGPQALPRLDDELFTADTPGTVSAAATLAQLVQSILTERTRACAQHLRARHSAQSQTEQTAALVLRDVLQLPAFLFEGGDGAARAGPAAPLPAAAPPRAPKAAATRAVSISSSPNHKAAAQHNSSADGVLANAPARSLASVNDSFFAVHVSLHALVLFRTCEAFLDSCEANALHTDAAAQEADDMDWHDLMDAKAAFCFFSAGEETAAGLDAGAGSHDGETAGEGEAGATPLKSAAARATSVASLIERLDPSPQREWRLGSGGGALTPERGGLLLRSVLLAGRAASFSPDAAHRCDGGGGLSTPSRVGGGEGGAASGGEAVSPPTATAVAATTPLFMSDAAKQQRRRAFTRFMLGALSELSAGEQRRRQARLEAHTAPAAAAGPPSSTLDSTLTQAWQTLQSQTIEPLVAAMMTGFCVDPLAIATFSLAMQSILQDASTNHESGRHQEAHQRCRRVLEERVVMAGLQRSVEAGVSAAADALARYLAGVRNVPPSLLQTEAAPGAVEPQNTTAADGANGNGAPATTITGPLDGCSGGERPRRGEAMLPVSSVVVAHLCSTAMPTAAAAPTRSATSAASAPAASMPHRSSGTGALAMLLSSPDAQPPLSPQQAPATSSAPSPDPSSASSLRWLFALGDGDGEPVSSPRGRSKGGDAGGASAREGWWWYPSRFFQAETDTAHPTATTSASHSREGEDEGFINGGGAPQRGGREGGKEAAGDSTEEAVALRRRHLHEAFFAMTRAVCQLPHFGDAPHAITGSTSHTLQARARALLRPLLSWARTAAEDVAAAEAALSAMLHVEEEVVPTRRDGEYHQQQHQQQRPSHSRDDDTKRRCALVMTRLCELAHTAQVMWLALAEIGEVHHLQQGRPTQHMSRRGETAAASVSGFSDDDVPRTLQAAEATLRQVQLRCEAQWQRLLSGEYRDALVRLYRAGMASRTHAGGGSVVQTDGGDAYPSLPPHRRQARALYRLQHAQNWRRVGSSSAAAADGSDAAQDGAAVYAPFQPTGDLTRLLFAVVTTLLSFQEHLVHRGREVARAHRAASARMAPAASEVMRGCYMALHEATASAIRTDVAQDLLALGKSGDSLLQDVWLQLYLDSDVATRVWRSSLLALPSSSASAASVSASAPLSTTGQEPQQEQLESQSEKQREQLLAFLASQCDALQWRSASLSRVLATHASSVVAQCALSFGLPSVAPLSSPLSTSLAAPIPLAVRPLHEVERFSLLPISSSSAAASGATMMAMSATGVSTSASSTAAGGGVAALHPASAARLPRSHTRSPPPSRSLPYPQHPSDASSAALQPRQDRYAPGAGYASASSATLAGGNAGGDGGNALASALWGSTQRGWNTLWGQQHQQQQGSTPSAGDDSAFFFGTV